MNHKSTARVPRALALLTAVCALATAIGCQPSARDLTLNKDLARQSLTRFLDCWSKGEPSSTLQSGSPAITGRDPAWEAGGKLVRYSLGSETDDGTNLHVSAELVLNGPSGQPTNQSVTYIVGTSPVITIFRNE